MCLQRRENEISLETKYRANAAYTRFYIHVTFTASGNDSVCVGKVSNRTTFPQVWKVCLCVCVCVCVCVCLLKKVHPSCNCPKVICLSRPFCCSHMNTHTEPFIAVTVTFCHRVFLCSDDFSPSTTARASSPPRPVAKQKKKKKPSSLF